MKVFEKYSGFIKSLGPGLLWAGAAIGVSHLVQSTRAGANYGYAMVWVVILANIMKYPFFEFGPRYAASTDKTLIEGYFNLGKWVLVLYVILTFLTMFTIQAAVTVVTAGILSWLFGGIFSPLIWSIIILFIVMIILITGKYSLLDRAVKIIIIILSITTLIALIFALSKFNLSNYSNTPVPDIWNKKGVLFMIALMGWMPSAIDISVWSSIWTVEKKKSLGYKPSLKQVLFDFNLGYIGTSIISLAFLTLGAMVVFGSDVTLSKQGGKFAGQFIGLYTQSIGKWSLAIVALAALTTMFSTTLTCVDAFSRVLDTSYKRLFNRDESDINSKNYLLWMLLVVIGAVFLLSVFKSSMGFMVDLATTLSFLTAPILAIINFKVITGKDIKEEDKIPRWLFFLSIAGILFLIIFGFIFLYYKFIIH